MCRQDQFLPVLVRDAHIPRHAHTHIHTTGPLRHSCATSCRAACGSHVEELEPSATWSSALARLWAATGRLEPRAALIMGGCLAAAVLLLAAGRAAAWSAWRDAWARAAQRGRHAAAWRRSVVARAVLRCWALRRPAWIEAAKPSAPWAFRSRSRGSRGSLSGGEAQEPQAVRKRVPEQRRQGPKQCTQTGARLGRRRALGGASRVELCRSGTPHFGWISED